MEKLIIYPADEKQSKALKEVLHEMQIDYSSFTKDAIEEVEDEELLSAMKEVENETPLSESEQAEFLKWVKQQV